MFTVAMSELFDDVRPSLPPSAFLSFSPLSHSFILQAYRWRMAQQEGTPLTFNFGANSLNERIVF
jgi:hypothetical protein